MTVSNLQWDDIHHVFLDMDGTLLDLHFDNHFWLHYLPEHYARENGIDPGEARELLYERFAATEGTLNWYCLDYWSAELDVDVVELKKEVTHLIQVHEQVVDLLDHLRQGGKRLVLLTNAHRGSLNLKIEKTGIDGHFDRVISSHDLGIAKETPGFWESLRDIEAYEPAHSLMVDDSLSVLHNARASGIGYVLAVRWPDTRQDERTVEDFDSVRGVSELLHNL